MYIFYQLFTYLYILLMIMKIKINALLWRRISLSHVSVSLIFVLFLLLATILTDIWLCGLLLIIDTGYLTWSWGFLGDQTKHAVLWTRKTAACFYCTLTVVTNNNYPHSAGVVAQSWTSLFELFLFVFYCDFFRGGTQQLSI